MITDSITSVVSYLSEITSLLNQLLCFPGKKLTKILEEKRAKSMQGNKRALGNSGGDQSNLVQYSSEVQKLRSLEVQKFRSSEVRNA